MFSKRTPDDGYYPTMKRPEELMPEDISILIKNKQFNQVERLIWSESPSMFTSPQSGNRMVDELVIKLHDTNGDLL